MEEAAAMVVAIHENGGGQPDSHEPGNEHGIGAFFPQASFALALFLAVALVASAAAAIGWTRTPSTSQPVAPSIRIVDVRPLRIADPNLRDLITHTFAVRVAIRDWTLLPYEPGVTARANHPRAGHWRLYLDGASLGDNFGIGRITYTPYLSPGTHWIAAELSNADATGLDPPVWSEPVILHVPRVIRCWQTGWRGSPEAGTPTFTCRREDAKLLLSARRQVETTGSRRPISVGVPAD
jgi:hypothetical protein